MAIACVLALTSADVFSYLDSFADLIVPTENKLSMPRPRCLVLSLLSSALPMPSSTAASTHSSLRLVLIIIACISPYKSAIGCISTITIVPHSYFSSIPFSRVCLFSSSILLCGGHHRGTRLNQPNGTVGPHHGTRLHQPNGTVGPHQTLLDGMVGPDQARLNQPIGEHGPHQPNGEPNGMDQPNHRKRNCHQCLVHPAYTRGRGRLH